MFCRYVMRVENWFSSMIWIYALCEPRIYILQRESYRKESTVPYVRVFITLFWIMEKYSHCPNEVWSWKWSIVRFSESLVPYKWKISWSWLQMGHLQFIILRKIEEADECSSSKPIFWEVSSPSIKNKKSYFSNTSSQKQSAIVYLVQCYEPFACNKFFYSRNRSYFPKAI